MTTAHNGTCRGPTEVFNSGRVSSNRPRTCQTFLEARRRAGHIHPVHLTRPDPNRHVFDHFFVSRDSISGW